MSDSGIPRLVHTYKQLVMAEQGRLQMPSSCLQTVELKNLKSSILQSWQSRASTNYKDELEITPMYVQEINRKKKREERESNQTISGSETRRK